ncbi:hypothetical protein L0991_12335 [Vibrio chagasii]|uniref:sugar-transfer associated ATP-grasp domain-containing protein n=1 Tax=Vibrio chagasii TaxID=170679 RepID=UPI0035A70C2A
MVTEKLLLMIKSPVTLFKIISANIKTLRDKRSYSHFEKKHKLLQAIDLFLWSVKHWEENDYYYHYKLDDKGSNAEGYISKKSFMALRYKSNTYFSGNRAIQYICFLSDKILFSKTMEGSVRIPKTVFYIRDGKINDKYDISIENIKVIVGGRKKFILKDSFGQEAGKIGVESDGVLLIKLEGSKVYINNKERNETYFNELLLSKSEWIAQELIIQAKDISALNHSSVNTIRLLTVINHGKVEICKAVMKVGASGEIVDNFWTGGVLINIDIETGCFTEQCLYETSLRDRQETDKLINSVKGKRVKNWCDVINQASNAHQLLPKIKSIGWDVAITEEGACIIEGNDNWDVVMFQAFEPLEDYIIEKLS